MKLVDKRPCPVTRKAIGSLTVVALCAALISPAWGQDLYVGTAGGPAEQGVVYKHMEGANWLCVSLGTDLGKSVMSMAAYRGRIYAGTQTCAGFGGGAGTGKVWRYDGDQAWTLVGTMGTSAMGLAVYQDALYCAATDLNDAGGMNQKLFRYENVPGSWTLVGSGKGTGFRAAVVSNVRGIEELYLGELNSASFYRYTALSGLELAGVSTGAAAASFKSAGSKLYAGGLFGSFYTSADGAQFRKFAVGTSHVWAVESFQGKLYAGTALGTYPGMARLMTWNDATGTLTEVKRWDATSEESGVTSLATDGTRLFIGMGSPQGYFSGSSGSAVWVYDGTSFASTAPLSGSGVQSMLVAPPMVPALSIVEARVYPAEILPGGSALVMVKAEGLAVTTSEASLKVTLPQGWSLDPIVGPSHGNGTFAAAVVAPGAAVNGTYPLEVSLEGATSSGLPVVSSQTLPLTLSVSSAIGATDGVLQLRAYDMNLEDAVAFPAGLDLSAYGLPLEQVRKQFRPTSGEISSSQTVSTTNGVTTTTQSYPYFPSATVWMEYSEGTQTQVDSATDASLYRYYLTEARCYMSFVPAAPAETLAALAADLRIVPFTSTPADGTFLVSLNGLSASPETMPAQTVFVDAGDGALAAPLTLQRGTGVTTSLAIPSGEIFLALDMIQESSSCEATSYTWTNGTTSGAFDGKHSLLNVGEPVLNMTYLVGVSPVALLEEALAAFWAGDLQRYQEILTALNDLYGRTPAEWGLVVDPLPQPEPEPEPEPEPMTLPLVMAASELSLDAGACVAGDAQSDGTAVLGGQSRVEGVLSAVAGVQLKGSKAGAGTIVSPAAPLFPALSRVLAEVGPVTTVQGDLKVSKKSNVSGVVFVTGDLTLTGGADVTATFIVGGDIRVSGQARVHAAVGGWALYTAGGTVKLSATEIQGRVAGNVLDMNGNVLVRP